MSSQEYLALGLKLKDENAFTVINALKSRETGLFVVTISPSRFLDPTEEEAVERVICDKLGTNNVRLEIDYSAYLDSLTELDDDGLCELFASAWKNLMPELVPVIRNSVITIDREDFNTAFTVRIPKQLYGPYSQEAVSSIPSAVTPYF